MEINKDNSNEKKQRKRIQSLQGSPPSSLPFGRDSKGGRGMWTLHGGSDWRLFAGEAGGGLISKADYMIGLGRISGFL